MKLKGGNPPHLKENGMLIEEETPGLDDYHGHGGETFVDRGEIGRQITKLEMNKEDLEKTDRVMASGKVKEDDY